MTTATKGRKVKAAKQSDEPLDADTTGEMDLRDDEPEETPAIEKPGRLQRLESIFATIGEVEREAAEAERQVMTLKDDLKAAKDHYEAVVIRLRKLCKQANDPQGELPFPDDSADATEKVAGDAWRAVTLEELEIAGKIAESLTEAGLTTLGAIADYSAADKILTDIQGVGPKAAEKIDAAIADWWQRHPGEGEGDSEEGEDPAPAVES